MAAHDRPGAGPLARGRGAAEDLEFLRAIERASSDPRRLIDTVSSTDNEDQAVDALRREFHLTEQTARVVIHQQIRAFTREALATLRQRIAAMEQEASQGHPG